MTGSTHGLVCRSSATVAAVLDEHHPVRRRQLAAEVDAQDREGRLALEDPGEHAGRDDDQGAQVGHGHVVAPVEREVVEGLAERGQAHRAVGLREQLMAVPCCVRCLARDGQLAVVDHVRRVELHQALEALLVLLGGRLHQLLEPVARNEHAGQHHASEALIHRVADVVFVRQDDGERGALLRGQLEVRTQRPELVADDGVCGYFRDAHEVSFWYKTRGLRVRVIIIYRLSHLSSILKTHIFSA